MIVEALAADLAIRSSPAVGRDDDVGEERELLERHEREAEATPCTKRFKRCIALRTSAHASVF